MRLPFVTGLILFPILHEFENVAGNPFPESGNGNPLPENGNENPLADQTGTEIQNGCDSLEDLETEAEFLDSLTQETNV